MYQVSPPCAVWYAGLRSEGVVTEKSAQGHVNSHHGNTEVYMRGYFCYLLLIKYS